MVDGVCRGVLAVSMEDGTFHRFLANQTILATGGMVEHTFLAHLHILAREMETPWLPELDFPCRTWNSCNFIPRAFMGPDA